MRIQKRKIIIALLALCILFVLLAVFPMFKGNEIAVARAEEGLENEETEEDVSAQELVIEIENDLNAQGKSIVGVLGEQKNNYETALSTATLEEESIIRAKLNTLEKAIEDSSSYMGDSNGNDTATRMTTTTLHYFWNVSPNCTCGVLEYLSGIPCSNCRKYTDTYMAVAAVIAGFYIRGWELAADLLLFNMTNTTLDIDYWPTLGASVAGAPQIANDLAQNDILAGGFEQESPGDYNGISASTIEGDVFNALGAFYYSKKPIGNGMIQVFIQDRYDWDEPDGDSSIANILFSVMFTAQEMGILTPFYTKIDLTMPGHVPFDWEYTNDGVEITGVAADVTKVNIPTTIKDMRAKVEELEDINITSIADNVFTNNTKITGVYIPSTVVSIGDNAFVNCTNLQYVEGMGVVTIGARAFKNCTELMTVRFSPALAFIYADAFYGCSQLRQFGATYNKLILPSRLEEVGAGAFYGTAFQYIQIGAKVNRIGAQAFSNMNLLENITVDSGNEQYCAGNGTLFDMNGHLLQYSLNRSNTSYTVPEWFYNPVTVEEVIVKYIDDGAFMGAANLTSVDFGNIESIGKNAFLDCSSLTTLTGTENIERIGAHAFDNTSFVANNTNDFIIIGKVLYKYNGTDILIFEPNFPPVKSIAPYAFSGNTTLEWVGIWETVEHIGEYAFADCSKLEWIRTLATTLPKVEMNFWANPVEGNKVYCRNSLIDTANSANGWSAYADKLSPVTTVAYFEDIDEYVNFYFGDTIDIPDTIVEGWYNQGWRQVNESTGVASGAYLTEIVWQNLSETIRYKADLVRVEDYTFEFYNGDVLIGSFPVSLGDTYALTKTGYTLNGTTYTFANAAEMTNCVYGDYYGPTVVDGVTIAYFDAWWLDGEMLVWGTWNEYYHHPRPRFQANWAMSMFYALLNNGYGTTQYVEFNYYTGLLLPTPAREGYRFKGWMAEDGTVYEGDEVLNVTENLRLTAQWARIYNITYANMTFMGQAAEVIWNQSFDESAPTYYEYGKGLDLSLASAFWQTSSPYSSRLVFLGWYMDMTFTTKVTSISTTQTGDVTLYAKWRYDFDQSSRYGEYIITDVDPYTEAYYDEIWLGLKYNNLYQELKNIGIKYIYIEFKLKIQEINDGYQEVLIYKDTSPASNPIWSVTDIQHYPSAVGSTANYYIWHCTFNIDTIKDCNNLYVRYGAHGNDSDTWVTEEIYMDIMYTSTTDSEENVKEFTWDYSADVNDEDCIPLENVSGL